MFHGGIRLLQPEVGIRLGDKRVFVIFVRLNYYGLESLFLFCIFSLGFVWIPLVEQCPFILSIFSTKVQFFIYKKQRLEAKYNSDLDNNLHKSCAFV